MSRKHYIPLIALFLFSCSSSAPQPPDITFFGIAPAALDTPIDELAFSDRFPSGTQRVTAAVQFAHAETGTTVTASWFVPDDRRPPVGRRTMEIQSGALLARFSLSNAEGFPAGPYMLIVRAQTPTGKDKPPLTDSGSLHFFVGMSDEEVAAYQEEYKAWLEKE